MRWLFKILKVLGLALAAAALLAVIAGAVLIGWLHTGSGRSWVRGELEEQLEDRVNGEVSLGRLRGSVLGDATVSELHVSDARGREVLAADEVRVRYDLLPLLGQTFRAESIDIVGLEVIDRGNLGELFRRREGPPSAWEAEIERLTVEEGNYRRPSEEGELEIAGISARGAVAYRPDLLRIAVDGASGWWTQRDLPLRLSGVLRRAGDELRARNLLVGAGDSTLRSAFAAADLEQATFFAEVRLGIEPEELERLFDPRWEGALRASGLVARGPDGVFRAVLGGTAGGAPFGLRAALSEESGQARVALRGVEPRAIYVGAPDGRLDVSADLELRGKDLEALFDPARVRFRARVRASGGLAGARARALTLTASRAGEPVRATLRARGLELPGQSRIASLAARARLERLDLRAGGALSLEARDLRLGAERADAFQADLRLLEGRRIAGRLEARGGPEGLTGSTRVRVGLGEGRPGDEIALALDELRLTVRNLTWRGRARASWVRDEALTIEGLALRSRAGRIALSGRIAAGGERGGLRARIRGLQLGRLPVQVSGAPALRGRLDGDARVDLSRRRVRGRLEAKGLAWQEGAPRIDASLRIRGGLRHAELAVTARAAELGRLAAEITARPPARPLSAESWRRRGRRVLEGATVEIRGLDLEALGRLSADAPEIEGEVSGTLEIEERARLVRADLRVRGGRSAPLARPLDLDVRAEAEGSRTEAEAEIRTGSQRLATASLAIERGAFVLWQRGPGAFADAPVSASIEVPEMDVALLFRTFGRDLEGVTGRLAADVEIEGTFSRPRWRGELRAPQLRLGTIAFEEVTLSGRGQGDSFRGELEGRQQAGGVLTATARGQLDPAAPLSAEVRARDFRLEALSAAAREIDVANLEGRLSAQVEVGGTARAPEIDGWARVRGGAARLPFALRLVSNLDAYAQLSGDRLDVQARGRSDRGRARLSARAELRDYVPVAIEARAQTEELPLLVAGDRLSVTAKARGSARLEDELWRGDVVIEEGSVRLPPRFGRRDLHPTGMPPDVVFVGSGEGIPVEPARGPWLRLDIRTASSVRLTGDRELRTQVTAALDVTLVDSEPVVSGWVAASGGQIEILDRRYDIERARAAFDGETPPDPSLDVSVSHDFEEVTVYIDVRGKAREPEVELRSDTGGYSEAELLGFVLGGRPGAGAEPGQGLAGGAATALGSFVAGQIGSLFQGALPFDVVRFGGGEERAEVAAEEDGAEPAVSQVTVGKWLSEDLFIAYRRRFDAREDESMNVVELEYHFLRQWRLSGTVGDRGTGSLDVLWVRRF